MTLDRSALDALNRAYFSDHPDEESVLARLPELLKDCRHFLDIGASLGQFTFNASRIMRAGRIDAFEADPGRAEQLRKNLAEWAATTPVTMTAHQLAVGRESGTVAFYSTQSNVSGGMFPNDLAHLDDETRKNVAWTRMDVGCVSLDQFYGDTTPDFIKMDIEGAEGDALLGAARLVRRRRTRWLIELHGFEGGWKPRQVIDYMRSHRYREEELAPDRVLFTPMSFMEYSTRRIGGWARASVRLLRRAVTRVAP